MPLQSRLGKYFTSAPTCACLPQDGAVSQQLLQLALTIRVGFGMKSAFTSFHLPHLQINTEQRQNQRPRSGARTSSVHLQQTGDLAVTVSGVCLCAFCTTLLYHLL